MKEVTKISKEIEAVLKPYNDEIKEHIAGLVKKSDEDINRHTKALSEEFQGRVQVVAEQFGGLNTKIDKMQGTLDSHTEMIGTLLVDMTTLKGDVKSVKESLKTKVNRKKFVELERHVLAE